MYERQSHYVVAFDIGVIPYVANAWTRTCFPLKLYKHLASWKPVVASGVPGLARMELDVVLAGSTPAFFKGIQDAVARNGEADRRRRKQLAARNTWKAKTERLLELVQQEPEAARASN